MRQELGIESQGLSSRTVVVMSHDSLCMTQANFQRSLRNG